MGDLPLNHPLVFSICQDLYNHPDPEIHLLLSLVMMNDHNERQIVQIFARNMYNCLL